MTEQHVIFGTGPLGKSVMRALLADAKPVRMVSRSGNADVPAGVEVVAADAFDVNQTRAVTEDAAVVYQCAQPPYHKWVEQFPAMQDSIMQGAAAAGAKFIVAENLYMYGEVDGSINEDLPYTAHTRKGKVRAQMAKSLIDAHEKGVVRVAIARGSDFYGSEVRQSALGERTFAHMLQGKPGEVMGNPDMPHTYTVIDDFGRAMAILGERDEALGQAWHVPSPETLTSRQVVTMIAEQLGTEPKVSTMSTMMTRVIGLFMPPVRELTEMMYEFNKPFVVDHSKFANTFGNIATPHEEAIRQTIAWYRAQQSVANAA
jgi:nucleoside-diphosphate-sugar epimerase